MTLTPHQPPNKRRRILRGVAQGAALVGLLTMLASFGGAFHPALDSLAVGRVLLAFSVSALAVALPRHLRIGAWIGCAAALATVWAPLLLPAQGATANAAAPRTIVLYQKNLYQKLKDEGPIVADIKASGAQVVTLQEVGPAARRTVLGALSRSLPNQHWCPREATGVAIATELPVVAGTKGCGPGFARMQVMLDEEPVWVVSLHLLWPWPFRQPNQVQAVERELRPLTGPVILAGDFNAVPSMTVPARLGRRVGAKPARPARISYAILGVPLTIDHVFAPNGGALERRPRLGSDHFGLLARLPLP